MQMSRQQHQTAHAISTLDQELAVFGAPLSIRWSITMHMLALLWPSRSPSNFAATELAFVPACLCLTPAGYVHINSRLLSLSVGADSAAQLAAVASVSEPEKENVIQGASAMVSDALRLQPLLARAENLNIGKKWQGNTIRHSQDGRLYTFCLMEHV